MFTLAIAQVVGLLNRMVCASLIPTLSAASLSANCGSRYNIVSATFLVTVRGSMCRQCIFPKALLEIMS